MNIVGIVIIAMWLVVGLINLILLDKINKTTYFCTWLVLMLTLYKAYLL